MNIEEKAYTFAVKAHYKQVRKSEIDKPMIVHPINVANIIRKYGFDSNVVAAGYLHDVVEDTKYSEQDILDIFGEDIRSLVMGDSEPDKSLSWEDRKQHTIDEVKTLDLRHKAVVCGDKISNLEDLRILSEKNNNYNFSAFKRGFKDQKWYYEGVYNSLIINEDSNLPMFVRLKKLIDHIFNNEREYNDIKDTIFKDKIDEFNKLTSIHFKKQEIYKLNSIFNSKPYVIEFTGTPRTGKTTLINNLIDFFKKGGFNIIYLEEFTTSKKYKQEIYPLLKDQYKNVVNTKIPKYVLSYLNEALDKNPDIIIVDRCLFDRLVWVDRLYLKKGMTKKEYNDYKKLYIPLINKKINTIIELYTDSLTSLKRDYRANLSIEPRHFLTIDNVDEYNKSLLNMNKEVSVNMFDTTDKGERDISFEVVNTILDNMRKNRLEIINNEIEKIIK